MKDDDDHFNQEVDEYDPKQYDEDFDKIESEDILEHNFSFDSKNFNKTDYDRLLSNDHPPTPLSSRG